MAKERISKASGWPFGSPEHLRHLEAIERNAKHDKAVAAWSKATTKKKSRKKKARSPAQKAATKRMLVAATEKRNRRRKGRATHFSEAKRRRAFELRELVAAKKRGEYLAGDQRRRW